MTDLPYKKEKGQTHWEGCWATPHHHNCAVAKIDDLTDELLAAYEQIKHFRKTSDEAYAKGFADTRERAAIRGRIAQLEGKLVDVEIRAMKPDDVSQQVSTTDPASRKGSC